MPYVNVEVNLPHVTARKMRFEAVPHAKHFSHFFCDSGTAVVVANAPEAAGRTHRMYRRFDLRTGGLECSHDEVYPNDASGHVSDVAKESGHLLETGGLGSKPWWRVKDAGFRPIADGILEPSEATPHPSIGGGRISRTGETVALHLGLEWRFASSRTGDVISSAANDNFLWADGTFSTCGQFFFTFHRDSPREVLFIHSIEVATGEVRTSRIGNMSNGGHPILTMHANGDQMLFISDGGAVAEFRRQQAWFLPSDARRHGAGRLTIGIPFRPISVKSSGEILLIAFEKYICSYSAKGDQLGVVEYPFEGKQRVVRSRWNFR